MISMSHIKALGFDLSSPSATFGLKYSEAVVVVQVAESVTLMED